MPKINVYLPDDLAEAVKEAGVPVSAVCQRALEQAVRRVTAIRRTVLSDLDLDVPTGGMTHLTAKMRTVIKLAADQAEGAGVGTEHLLAGMLTEGTNLALHVLRAMDIDLEQVKRDLARHQPPPAEQTGAGAESPAPRSFSGPAANALEFAANEAISLGHNYVGCEHLLLGLVAEPDGTAGQVLRALGVEPRLARRAVTAALAGYVHLRAQTQQADPAAQSQGLAALIRNELQPLVQRLERLEEHVGLGT